MRAQLTLLTLLVAVVCALILVCDYAVRSAAARYTYDDVETIPAKDLGLLLGTSKRVEWSGRENLFFKKRIAAAVSLFRAGKIKHILISGDNRDKYYNEPDDMRKELVASGIPQSAIYLDPAGLRTYDSIVRAAKIFRQKDFIVISQRFHNERAIYIAQWLGLNVIGYNAADVSGYYGLKVWLRERLARVNMMYELYTSAVKGDVKVVSRSAVRCSAVTKRA